MSFDIELLEKNFVDRITALLTGSEFEVIALPDNDSQYSRAVNKPRVTVAFVESNADKPLSTSSVVQNKTIHVGVQIQAPKLRAAQTVPAGFGIYNVEALIRKYLIGWRPDHCGKVFFVSFTSMERKDNIFNYGMILGTTFHIVEDVESSNDPLITQITTNTTGNEDFTVTN